jgi:hypothetical protein
MAIALINNALPTAYHTASNTNMILNDELERSQERNVFSFLNILSKSLPEMIKENGENTNQPDSESRFEAGTS